MAAIPKRAENCEQVLIGSRLKAESQDQAKAALRADFSPISDCRSSADYRMLVAGNLLERMAREITGHSEISVWEAAHA